MVRGILERVQTHVLQQGLANGDDMNNVVLIDSCYILVVRFYQIDILASK